MNPRCFLPCLTSVLSLFGGSLSLIAQEVIGYRSEEAAALLSREKAFDAQLDPANLKDWMRQMTDRPHHAGSTKAKENAMFIAKLFESWGYDTTIETYHVLFPTPKIRELRQLRPLPVTLSLKELIVGTDSAAEALRNEALPPYNAYSADGNVVGSLVYVNQGLPRDYEELALRGIDVKGKIVIARYGGSWRGIKPKVAHEHGAIGCIIYNDPSADGFALGAAYPNGAFKHDSAVQRGSVVDLPMRPGDPLTPNYGATRDAKRLSVSESETVMKIPVLPISSVDAEILLKTLDGPVAPDAWRGALPLTYRLGGGGTVVRLNVAFNWDLVPAYNVIAKFKGSTFPDEWVIRGNHHDGWVIGARDPMSGMVTVLEQARACAELIKQGWRPKRTLVFCSWDAEEPGLLGSTEWAEDHAKILQEKAVAYINTDGNSRGFLRIGGSHALESLAGSVAHEVEDPQTGISVSDRLRASMIVNGSPKVRKMAKQRKDLYLNALGSGSDYTVFLQHLGIPTFNVSFSGEGFGGEYHTCFDTFDHFTKFIDPGFEYGVALTQICGRLTLRLLDAEILPFQFQAASDTFSRYADDLDSLLKRTKEETERHNLLIQENYLKLASDPTLTFVAPAAKERVPFVNFAPLLNNLERLKVESDSFQKAWADYFSQEDRLSSADLKAINRLLYQAEQQLVLEEGLPRRPWFRHQVYAPGFYTGYGVKTFPGIREAIEEAEWEQVDEQVGRAAGVIWAYADRVSQASALLRAAEGDRND
ncbi:MAG: M28 family peptidase [Verrucomicrobia bacterium]|jgi:N-acetylated-alpha-linked acidic dipeptidase|nr:M28 family peptidase [Verrucomicrobiota bacterium]